MDALQAFLALLAERAPGMTKGQRSVAEQMAQDPAALAFASADEIAAAAGVGQTTVIRTAYELGFDGYAALQNHVRGSVRGRRLARYQESVAALEHGAGASRSVLLQVLEADIENLRRTAERIAEAQFQRAVDILAGSERIFVAGYRAAFGTAHFLAYNLGGIADNVTLLDTDTHHFQRLNEFGPGTVVVGISFPRYTQQTIDILEFARRRDCQTIGITDNPVSPLGSIVDVALTVEIGSPAATDSHTAAVSLAMALLTGVAMALGERASGNLSRIEETMREWQQVTRDQRLRGGST
jgi:DNA-binding MurR/RpiR family transcriptional regulator